MNFIVSLFNRDPLSAVLSGFSINSKINQRCDLLNRSRLVAYFDPKDQYGRNALLKLFQLANKPETSPVKKIKIVMLLHALVMTSPCFYDILLDNELVIPEALAHRDNTEPTMDSWIQYALVQYYNYVRRICLHSILYEECKMRITYPEDDEQCIQTIYLLINLMKSICPIKQFMLHVGRYYFQEYLFVIDINRIIALDLVRLYNNVSVMVGRLYRDYQTRLSRQQAWQLLNIIDQTYKLHEEMYVIMYNRYYFSFMELVTPYWFNLEARQYEQLRDYAMGRAQRRNITLEEIDLQSFESTFQDVVRRRRASEVLPDL